MLKGEERGREGEMEGEKGLHSREHKWIGRIKQSHGYDMVG